MPLGRVLLYNGNFWTPPKNCSWVIIDVFSGTFLKIGHGKPDMDEPVDESIDLSGACVLPGLTDSHIHVYSMGQAANNVDLSGCASVSDIQECLSERAGTSSADWVVGVLFDHEKLSEGRFPTRMELDKAVGGRPCVIYRVCWHVGVANTAAFNIAHIPVKRGGAKLVIQQGSEVTYDETGWATGLLSENALELIVEHIDEKDPKIAREFLQDGLRKCVESGLTHVQTNDWGAVDIWELYSTLHKENQLPVRVSWTPTIERLQETGSSISPGMTTSDYMLRTDRCKIFSDGSLGAETAALREPYVEESGQSKGTRGTLLLSDDALQQRVNWATSKGWRLEIHAIGDRAAEQVLTAWENSPNRPERPLLTHCQVLGPDLMESMSRLNVVANIQPPFLPTDAQWVERRLPRKIRKWSYAWKTLIDKGVHCAGGSDAPVEGCSPLKGIFDAIYRETADGIVVQPNERLSLSEAIELYTTGGAYAAGLEDRLGRIDPAFFADLVVLHQSDVFKKPRKFASATVSEVWVHGVSRYRAGDKSEGKIIGNPRGQGKNGRLGFCPCCKGHGKL